MTKPTHIVHVVHRLAVGGMENGLVNLINHLPANFQHTVVCLHGYTDFAQRIQKPVTLIDLKKKAGQDWGLFGRFYRLLRQLKPDVVHTRNLATIEMQLPAFLARVPKRIHSEHGRDLYDINHPKKRYERLRRWILPLTHQVIALSQPLYQWLQGLGVKPDRLHCIINGVDTQRFHGHSQPPSDWPFAATDPVIGGVGRLETIKDPLNLAQAFLQLKQHYPQLKLVWVGDGGLQATMAQQLQSVAADVWLAGDRQDIAHLLPQFSCFVLPSRSEGISNTLLEAMACQRPIVATAVGGNSQLIETDLCGQLVPAEQPTALAKAVDYYLRHPEQALSHGQAARQRCLEQFSLVQMMQRYQRLYSDG